MNTKRWLGTTLLSFRLLAAFGINAQQVKKLTAVEAKSHIGEQAIVCGIVASTRYAATTRGKPRLRSKPYSTGEF